MSDSWKDRLRSASVTVDHTMADSDKDIVDKDTSFTLGLIEAFKDADVIKSLKMAIQPLISPTTESIKQVMQMNTRLQQQLAERDLTIGKLTQEIEDLKVRADDQEQQGRKGSIRVFGIPEETAGSVDDKILAVCNAHLELQPPLVLEEIEVAHRLGKPPVLPESDGNDGADGPPPNPPKPRAIIVKFASRRSKARVMHKDNLKKLKTNPVKHVNGSDAKVMICDDLTKRRAYLAYQARCLKRDGHITDTWTSDSKILIKDNYNRIRLVKTSHDLSKFQSAAQPSNEGD